MLTCPPAVDRRPACRPRPAGGGAGLRAASRRLCGHHASTRASRARARPAPMPSSSADLRRLRHEPAPAARDRRRARASVVSEQQSQMTESRDGKKLRFEHRSDDRRHGRPACCKGDALLGDDGRGQARFSDPEGQTVALPARHAVPRRHRARDDPPGQGGRRRLRRAVLLRREGEAAAVGQHGDRQGAQAARRREDPRGRASSWPTAARASITAAGFFEAQAKGKEPGRAGLRDEQHHARQRHRALRHPRGERRRHRVPHHAARAAAQAGVQVSGPRSARRMGLTPEQAVDRLEELHAPASNALREALARFTGSGVVPTAQERRGASAIPNCASTGSRPAPCPSPAAPGPSSRRPAATRRRSRSPGFFRHYLLEQLRPLAEEFGARIEVGVSAQEIPYPYVTEAGDEFVHGDLSVAELARHFPTPHAGQCRRRDRRRHLAASQEGEPRPLALFDAVRVDYLAAPAGPLHRHRLADDPALDPAHQLPALRRPVRALGAGGAAQAGRRLRRSWRCRAAPSCGAATTPAMADAAVAAAPWHRFQMPAYHLMRARRQGGITIVNIGVGPSNAKNITDHLAVLRPHCWLMIGHCGGLRQSQTIGDYVLAHGYLRRDRILDDLVPPEVPVPALAEVQVALQEAAGRVTGERGDALKRRLRTGTVVTYDDRNWELRWSQERRRINLSRAIAVDMESATLAPRAIACACPTARCSASPTSRCTARSSCPARPRASTSARSASICSIGLETHRPAARRAGARCIRASCAASTSRRSADGSRTEARAPNLRRPQPGRAAHAARIAVPRRQQPGRDALGLGEDVERHSSGTRS